MLCLQAAPVGELPTLTLGAQEFLLQQERMLKSKNEKLNEKEARKNKSVAGDTKSGVGKLQTAGSSAFGLDTVSEITFLPGLDDSLVLCQPIGGQAGDDDVVDFDVENIYDVVPADPEITDFEQTKLDNEINGLVAAVEAIDGAVDDQAADESDSRPATAPAAAALATPPEGPDQDQGQGQGPVETITATNERSDDVPPAAAVEAPMESEQQAAQHIEGIFLGALASALTLDSSASLNLGPDVSRSQANAFESCKSFFVRFHKCFKLMMRVFDVTPVQEREDAEAAKAKERGERPKFRVNRLDMARTRLQKETAAATWAVEEEIKFTWNEVFHYHPCRAVVCLI